MLHALNFYFPIWPNHRAVSDKLVIWVCIALCGPCIEFALIRISLWGLNLEVFIQLTFWKHELQSGLFLFGNVSRYFFFLLHKGCLVICALLLKKTPDRLT